MRVAVHAGQLLQPVPGGIGEYVTQLLRALPAAGVEVTPFAAGAAPGPRGWSGWTDLGWPHGSLRYELWHRLRWPKVGAPGDVVHATSLAVPPPGDRPLVVTVHDLVFLHQPEHLTARGVAFHRRGLELARREAAAVIADTEFGRDDLVRAGFEPERVHVAYLGVDAGPSLEPSAVDATLERLGVQRPYVLFQSTIEPRKGLPDLLEAHRRLRATHPDLSLVVRGDHGWGELPDLTGAGVVHLGRLARADLDALYRGAELLAHPAHYEGFGFGVVEAMAHGCPVVTTDASCLPEVAGGAAVLVPAGDIDALTDAIDGLVGDDGARARLVAAGLQRAEAFTWQSCAAAHAEVYRKVVA
jgi:glycosyltransferase involved in cell wall biosynthesis